MMTARALVISVLEGEGEKDYGEGMEREKGEAKEKEGRGREIELSVQLSFGNIHVPITSCKDVWVGQLLARVLITVKRGSNST